MQLPRRWLRDGPDVATRASVRPLLGEESIKDAAGIRTGRPWSGSHVIVPKIWHGTGGCFEERPAAMISKLPTDSRTSVTLHEAAVGRTAIGALAVGAVALGALAVGAFAIGRLSVGRARIGRLEIGELTVDRLRIRREG